MKRTAFILAAVFSAFLVSSCGSDKKKTEEKKDTTVNAMREKVNEYAIVELKADISQLSKNEKQILSILFDVADIMDGIYWEQTLGDKKSFLDNIKDPDAKRFAEINYGPWDRLGDNKAFIAEFGEKPAGANFYPKDMTKEEFEKFADKNKSNQYTMIRRNEDGTLKVVWYHEYFKDQLQKASDLLLKAAELAEDPGLKKYFELRAKALLTSDYYASDMAWMDMKNSNIDFVVGPIENYEDALFGYKTAFESCILIKDIKWSKDLEKFAKLLPELQKQLPVDDKFKKEVPGASSDMNVYSILYYAGDCNAGGKTIAINRPNDEKVQLNKGTRKLQLKNSMQAKFDQILLPISNLLMDPSQRQYVKFDAFFQNVMFHEVAHGLGIKNTLNKKGTVREALKDLYAPIEECKADITGLFLVTKLREMGQITDGDLKNNYVAFVAGIFRSVRFGTADSHGTANMLCFNYLMSHAAISRNNNGLYLVNFDKMPAAVNSLVAKIITIQGNGDYDAAQKWIDADGKISPQLQKDLDKISEKKISRDIIFKQGKSVLGL